jgi:hypothetical protein
VRPSPTRPPPGFERHLARRTMIASLSMRVDPSGHLRMDPRRRRDSERCRGSADMRLGESNHGSSDDGPLFDCKVEWVALEVTPPENVSDHWQIEHTGFKAGVTGGVEGVLAG